MEVLLWVVVGSGGLMVAGAVLLSMFELAQHDLSAFGMLLGLITIVASEPFWARMIFKAGHEESLCLKVLLTIIPFGVGLLLFLRDADDVILRLPTVVWAIVAGVTFLAAVVRMLYIHFRAVGYSNHISDLIREQSHTL